MDALAESESLSAATTIANKLETKALQARKRASVNFILTMLIGMGILSLFLFAGPLTEAVRLQQLEKTITEAGRIREIIVSTVTTENKTANTAPKTTNSAEPKTESNQRPEKTNTENTTHPTNEPHETWLTEIVDSLAGTGAFGTLFISIIARIGAVLVGIILIQILVSFARYNYKLSEHLSACADMVRISRGDARIMKELAPVMFTALDFGGMPSSPFQKIVDTSMDTIKELAKKYQKSSS
jgi:hypothetical protein